MVVVSMTRMKIARQTMRRTPHLRGGAVPWIRENRSPDIYNKMMFGK
jgi:hypothetical protein